MNNVGRHITKGEGGTDDQVYTAPHAPARNETAPAAVAAAPVPAASATPAPIEKAPAPSPGEMHTNPIPPTDQLNVEKAPAPSPGEMLTDPIPATKDLNVEKAPVPSPGPTNTDPFNATSTGTEQSTLPRDTKTGVIPVLGNVISGSDTNASSASPAHTAPVIDQHPSVAIEKVAANANIGQEPTDHEQTMLERAQAYGMGAATTLTSAIGQAVHTVEEKTGLHLLQGDPVSC
jgi:hypothetical protein